MQRCEFEEKSYEIPLYMQLVASNKLIWTPGLVFEKYFGVDGGLYVEDKDIWNKLGFSNELKGAVLNDHNWGRIWDKVGHKKTLPNFELNLFIQAKRPDYLKGINPKYARFGITSEYYRFYITYHQQVALEYVAKRLKNKALLVYACPAFHTYEELFSRISDNSLIDSSTFIRIERMSTHEKWIFDSPGSSGLACSDIEKIKDKPIKKQLQELYLFFNEEKQFQDYMLNLNDLDKNILMSFKELLVTDNPIVKEFFRGDTFISKYITKNYSNHKFEKLYHSILRIKLFLKLTNLQWLTIG